MADAERILRSVRAELTQIARLSPEAVSADPTAGPGLLFSPRRIVRHRRALDLTPYEYGLLVGVTGTCVRNWEMAKSNPQMRLRARLAEVLGMTRAQARRALQGIE
jgi:DNA-binding transcriptional regulator YiaG